MSGGKSVAVNNFYAMSGKIDVNTKGESLRASGSGTGSKCSSWKCSKNY